MAVVGLGHFASRMELPMAVLTCTPYVRWTVVDPTGQILQLPPAPEWEPSHASGWAGALQDIGAMVNGIASISGQIQAHGHNQAQQGAAGLVAQWAEYMASGSWVNPQELIATNTELAEEFQTLSPLTRGSAMETLRKTRWDAYVANAIGFNRKIMKIKQGPDDEPIDVFTMLLSEAKPLATRLQDNQYIANPILLLQEATADEIPKQSTAAEAVMGVLETQNQDYTVLEHKTNNEQEEIAENIVDNMPAATIEEIQQNSARKEEQQDFADHMGMQMNLRDQPVPTELILQGQEEGSINTKQATDLVKEYNNMAHRQGQLNAQDRRTLITNINDLCKVNMTGWVEVLRKNWASAIGMLGSLNENNMTNNQRLIINAEITVFAAETEAILQGNPQWFLDNHFRGSKSLGGIYEKHLRTAQIMPTKPPKYYNPEDSCVVYPALKKVLDGTYVPAEELPPEEMLPSAFSTTVTTTSDTSSGSPPSLSPANTTITTATGDRRSPFQGNNQEPLMSPVGEDKRAFQNTWNIISDLGRFSSALAGVGRASGLILADYLGNLAQRYDIQVSSELLEYWQTLSWRNR